MHGHSSPVGTGGEDIAGNELVAETQILLVVAAQKVVDILIPQLRVHILAAAGSEKRTSERTSKQSIN